MDRDEELIWKFLDGDLTKSEGGMIEERLELDDRFRRHMADIRDLDKLLSLRTAELPPLRFTSTVMEKVRTPIQSLMEHEILSRKFTAWYLAIVAAMVAMAIGISIGIFNNSIQVGETSMQINAAMVDVISRPALAKFFQISIGLGLIFLLDAYLKRQQVHRELTT